MKKFGAVTVLSMLLVGGIYSTQAMAIGKGFYLQLGSGSSSWDLEDSYGFQWSFDADTDHAGVGFVLDTAPAEDRLFNYRFQIGYEQFVRKESSTSYKMDMDSLVIDQDFGFGIVRNERIRFWIGPQLRISFSGGTPEGATNYDVSLFGIGLGPVAGININTPTRLSFAFKFGIMAMSYTGVGDDTSTFNNDVDYTVDENYGFLNFAMLFR